MLGEAVSAVRLTAKPTSQSSFWRIHAPALALDTTSATGHATDGSTIASVMQEALEHAGCTPGDIQAIKLQAAGAPGGARRDVNDDARVRPEQPRGGGWRRTSQGIHWRRQQRDTAAGMEGRAGRHQEFRCHHAPHSGSGGHQVVLGALQHPGKRADPAEECAGGGEKGSLYFQFVEI